MSVDYQKKAQELEEVIAKLKKEKEEQPNPEKEKVAKLLEEVKQLKTEKLNKSLSGLSKEDLEKFNALDIDIDKKQEIASILIKNKTITKDQSTGIVNKNDDANKEEVKKNDEDFTKFFKEAGVN